MTRTDVLNGLAKKYGLKRYLEIGVQNPSQNFDKIVCEEKVGVDPDVYSNATETLTSDEFFKRNNSVYQLVFIDGLHEYNQAKRDLENSMRVLDPKGFVVMHDVNPKGELFTSIPRKTSQWYGDVYKLAASIQNEKWTIDDNGGGCMVIPYTEKLEYGEIPTWNEFVNHRDAFLKIVTKLHP